MHFATRPSVPVHSATDRHFNSESARLRPGIYAPRLAGTFRIEIVAVQSDLHSRRAYSGVVVGVSYRSIKLTY